ncbi:MAG: radical SAM protein [Prevotella sp.]|nr:radical SAM protein [Prevotella sp.]
MRRFLECLIPVTACNLKCSYCYVIQEGRRKNEKAIFKYSAETISKALSIKRLGGISLISITGSGETLIPKELPEIVAGILKQGHFVNITTNGILSARLDILLEATKGYHDHLHFSFSFHYIELKRKGLTDIFFKNIRKAKETGCSILLQINLVDEYIPYWNEIKRLSIEHVGALPQVALTRDESNHQYRIMSSLSEKEYISKGAEMKSPLFDFTCRFFNVKRKEFCYAGLWSAKLNLCTGEMSACYGNGLIQNIFEDINKPIKFEPIGHHCTFKYCFNSSHFISQGVIPELLPLPSYGELRNREEASWYSASMRDFLYKQFVDTNPLLSRIDKLYYDLKYIRTQYPKIMKKIMHKIKKTVIRIYGGLTYNRGGKFIYRKNIFICHSDKPGLIHFEKSRIVA